MEPGYPVEPVLCFLALIFVLIPLPWHWEAANCSTVGYMIWTALGLINTFVNMIVWHNNAFNPAPIWCDISAKFQVGFPIGIAAASLAINRRLYKITSVAAVRQSDSDRRKDMIVDLLLVLGLPIVVMAAHVIVQGHLGNIYEDFGCSTSTVNTLAAIFIVNLWPLLLATISGGYSLLVIRSFVLRRLEFNEFISSNNTITFDRYWRLMMLAMMDILITIPLSIYVIWLNVHIGLEPFINWHNIHEFFQRWAAQPRITWDHNPVILFDLRINAYLPIVCGFLFFLFFGLAQEARMKYRVFYWKVMKPFGIKPRPRATIGATGKLHSFNVSMGRGQMPVFANGPQKVQGSRSFLSSVGDISMDDDSKMGVDVEKSMAPSRASSVDLSSPADEITATLPVFQQTTTFTYIEPPPKSPRPQSPPVDAANAV